MLAACEDDKPEVLKPVRTVVVYMSAENSLSSFANMDFREIIEGSKLVADEHNLMVWYDRPMSNEKPWLCRIQKGVITDSVSIEDMGISTEDELSSDPKVFEQVLRYVYDNYPANDGYGLVLWGHATGWTLRDSIAYSRGYGIDNGYNNPSSNSGYWLNIPTIRKVLEQMPKQTFIFADCCNFMCLESIYELRNVADYIIGSPAEIPDYGAPYNTVVPTMFEHEGFAKSIIDKYSNAYPSSLPLSAVKTSEMEALAAATRNVLKYIATQPEGYAVKDSTIHYYYDGNGFGPFSPEYSIFFDAGDYIRSRVPEADYLEWNEVLKRAVVYKYFSPSWLTNQAWYRYYSDFTMTEEKYHGVSMFVPQDLDTYYYKTYNRDIKKFQWYYHTFE